MAISQTVTNGCYSAYFPGKCLYMLCSKDDSLFFSYSQYDSKENEKSTLKKNTPQYEKLWKVSIDSNDYILSPQNTISGQVIVLHSTNDSVILFQCIKRSQQGSIIWEIQNERAFYKESGQPADYDIFYFDSSDIESYPSYPIGKAKFKNAQKSGNEILFYSLKEVTSFEKEHGLTNQFSSTGCCWIKEKRKWVKGKLKGTLKKYKPGERFA